MSAPAEPRAGAPGDFDLSVYRHLVARHARLLAASALAGAVGGAAWALTRPVTYEASAQVLVEREDPAVVTFRRVGEVNERGFAEEYYQTQLRLLRGRPIAERVVERLGLADELPGVDARRDAGARRAAALGALQRNLKVEWIRLTRLVTVTFQAARPELAAEVANAVAEEYIAETVRARGRAASDAAALLAAEIEEQGREVAAAEAALQEIRRRDGLGDAVAEADDRRTIAEQRVRDVNMALNNTITRRMERETAYTYMKAASDPEELPDVVRNPVIQNLRTELAALERRLALLDVKYLDRHPEVLRTTRQIEETRARIAAEARRLLHVTQSDYEAAVAHERSLREASARAKQDLETLEANFTAFEAARRDLTASKTVLASLIVRGKEIDASRALQLSNARLAEPAQAPAFPRRASPAVYAAAGATLAGFLALVLLVARDRLDDSVRTPEDVRALPATLLTVVPPRPAGRPVLLRGSDDDAFRESYRLLCAALEGRAAPAGARVVLVTSTAAGEGKTVTAANLAVSLAARQDGVLLVDADLRKPRVHDVFSARSSPGLAEVLGGRVDAGSAIQRFEGTTLAVLAAGNANAGSPDRLEPGGLQAVLSALRAAHSWIVIDSPPVGPVADALALARLADDVILVVGAEATPRSAVAHSLDRLADAGGPAAGIVLNRARVDRYPQRYHFHYGHGYGERPRAGGAGAAGADAAA